ncbi:hypothetical protein J7I91_16075 [Pseudomonas sp. ISL-84]|nr:hypothetical protein [Pseudomonas sp. ISL-84]
MLSTRCQVIYQAYGLNIKSELPLPEIPMKVPEGEDIDITIKLDDLTKLWNEVVEPNRHFYVRDNTVLFQIPNTATYYVMNGKQIIVSPMDGTHADKVRLYILGTCMGALLMQRKILPLHGSAIAINEKAYAIVGDSGAGKSTLASAFLNKGYELISDDVIPVAFSNGIIPMVSPSYPQQKLWQQSLDAFGMESKGYIPIFDRETKFAVPVESKFVSKSLPLKGVFELVKTGTDEVMITPIASLQRLHTLFCHTYRNFLIDRLGLRDWHFSITANIADKIQLYQLQRPINRFTAHDLTSLILNTINEGE